MLGLAQNTLDGIAAGSAYALLAIGFTLTFEVMRLLNIAFGPSIMVVIFLGAWVHAQWSGHATGASLLLLDEPTAGATEAEVASLTPVMADHLLPGRTVLLVEHRLGLLRALCT